MDLRAIIHISHNKQRSVTHSIVFASISTQSGEQDCLLEIIFIITIKKEKILEPRAPIIHVTQQKQNKRAQRALERSPESEDFKEFPFFIALYTTGDTWGSKSEVMFKK